MPVDSTKSSATVSISDASQLDAFIGAKSKYAELTTEDLIKSALGLFFDEQNSDALIRGIKRFVKASSFNEPESDQVMLRAAAYLIADNTGDSSLQKQAAAWCMSERFVKSAGLSEFAGKLKDQAGSVLDSVSPHLQAAYTSTLGSIEDPVLRRALIGLLLGGSVGGAAGAIFPRNNDRGVSTLMGGLTGATVGGGVGALSGIDGGQNNGTA